MIKRKIKKKIKKKITVRHYQNITGQKAIERNVESLRYIIEYFREYNIWLRLIKKYNFNKF